LHGPIGYDLVSLLKDVTSAGARTVEQLCQRLSDVDPIAWRAGALNDGSFSDGSTLWGCSGISRCSGFSPGCVSDGKAATSRFTLTLEYVRDTVQKKIPAPYSELA